MKRVLLRNLTASVIYLVCMLMKGAVDELDAQHAQMLSPIYLSFFFFCVVTGCRLGWRLRSRRSAKSRTFAPPNCPKFLPICRCS